MAYAPLAQAQNAISHSNQRNVTQGVRKIDFAGVKWTVRNAFGGPGPNNWSDSEQSVWVDDDGRLHLKIRQINGIWHSAEICTNRRTTYGEHRFLIESDVTSIDENIVFGLFVFADDSNEIDIEFSKWGVASRRNVVGSLIGHYTGKPPADSLYVQRWNYKGADSPNPRRRIKTHINLWLFNGAPPVDTTNLEMIITDIIQPISQLADVADDHSPVPEQFVLHQNYPNPFSTEGRGTFAKPETTIRFFLDTPGVVSLKIYDIQGREMAALLDGARAGAGEHRAVFDAMLYKQGTKGLTSGIYFYTLTVRIPSTNRVLFKQTKKMLFVK